MKFDYPLGLVHKKHSNHVILGPNCSHSRLIYLIQSSLQVQLSYYITHHGHIVYKGIRLLRLSYFSITLI
jgi:hypothetical protein